MLPLGAWMPDRADYQNPGVCEALNVIPSHGSADGQIAYRPMQALTTYSSALPAACLGATGFSMSMVS